MSPDPSRPFTVEPWVVREPRLDLAALGQAESVFALSNGHIGLRGNLDEGDPHATPGTYLNSFFECRPLPYAEGGYGYPESGQTIINVTNGKLIRLLVEDEPLDLRYGDVRRHERVLDMQAGTLDPRGRVGVTGRPRGAGAQHPAGVVDPAGDRGHLLRGGGARRAGAARAAVRAGGQRGAARPGRGRPRGSRPPSPTCCRPSSSAATTPAPR